MSLAAAIEGLASAHRRGTTLVLLFDFDGTLAPVVTHPALVEMPAGARDLLRQLAAQPRVEIGLISGRSLADLKGVAGLEGAILAGTFGLEIDSPRDAFRPPSVEGFLPYLEHAESSLGTMLPQFPEAWIERKPMALTVHYRTVRRDLAPFLRQCVENVLLPYEGLLTSVDASKALEIFPDVGWDKGATLRAVVNRHLNSLVLYAGNDENDAPAIAAANDANGITIGVGPLAPAAARFRVAEPDALYDHLGQLCGFLRTH